MDGMTLPTSPFLPVPLLFLSASDSDLMAFMVEAYALIEGCPHLVRAVDADLDAHARDKRSAVESLMFTLKQGFHFGEVARRGLIEVQSGGL